MFERDLVLPESEREAFKVPLGSELPESLVDTTGETTYIAVGDVVSLVLRRCGARPVLSVYDGLTERREMTDFARLVEDEPRIDVVNPAGRISAGLAEALRRGIGGETADVILLYAFDRPRFVVDAYTRRLMGRLGHDSDDEGIREFFESGLGHDTRRLGGMHRLILEHGIAHCRKKPLCDGCPLCDICTVRA